MVLNLSFVNQLFQLWMVISKHDPLNIIYCLINSLKNSVNVVLYLIALFIKLVSDVKVREGRYYSNSWSCLVVIKLPNLLLHIISIPYPPIRKKIWDSQYLVFWNSISLGDILLEICRGNCYKVTQLHYSAYILLPFWIVECVISSVVYWNVIT